MNSADSGEEAWPELVRATKTIVVVDVVESVRLMQANEADVIDRWRRFVHEVRTQVLPAHQGRMVKSLGDGMLLEFEKVPPAISAIMDVQRRMHRYNEGRAADNFLRLRAGAHVCDVVSDQLDVYGNGVNIAARLSSAAAPGELWVTEAIRDELVDGLHGDIEDLGDHYFKHLGTPVKGFRVGPVAGAAVAQLPPIEKATADSRPPMVAVLPFQCFAGSVDTAIAGVIFVDQLIQTLSRVPSLQVLSRLSTQRLEPQHCSPGLIHSLLGADLVVSGTVVAQGEQIRFRGELAECPGGGVLWAGELQGPAKDLLLPDGELMTDFAQGLLEAVGRRLTARAADDPLTSLNSYALLYGGVSLMHRFAKNDFARAHQLLLELARRQPLNPLPHAWLGRWHLFNVVQGHAENVEQERECAGAAIARALDLSPDSAIALTIAGAIEVQFAKDVEAGQRLYQRAIQANPNEPLAWLLSGTAHAFKGDGQQALSASGQALKLSPIDPLRFLYDCHRAGTALAAGQYDDAIRLARQSLRQNMAHLSTYRVLAIAQVLDGQVDEARGTVQTLLGYDPRQSVSGYLRNAPAARYPIGQLFGRALREAGLPE